MPVVCYLPTAMILADLWNMNVVDTARLLDETREKMASSGGTTQSTTMQKSTAPRSWPISVVSEAVKRMRYDFVKVMRGSLLALLQSGATVLLMGTPSSSFVCAGRSLSCAAEVCIAAGQVLVHGAEYSLEVLGLTDSDSLQSGTVFTSTGLLRQIVRGYILAPMGAGHLLPLAFVSARVADVMRRRLQDLLLAQWIPMGDGENHLICNLHRASLAYDLAYTLVTNALGGEGWVTLCEAGSKQSRMGTLGRSAFLYMYTHYLDCCRTARKELIFYNVGSGFLMISIAMGLMQIPVHGCELNPKYFDAGERLLSQLPAALFRRSMSFERCSFDAAKLVAAPLFMYVNSLGYEDSEIDSQAWLKKGLKLQARVASGTAFVLATNLIPGLDAYGFSSPDATESIYSALHGSGATERRGLYTEQTKTNLFRFYKSTWVGGGC